MSWLITAVRAHGKRKFEVEVLVHDSDEMCDKEAVNDHVDFVERSATSRLPGRSTTLDEGMNALSRLGAAEPRDAFG